ncbi:MAG: hypothetical protein WDO73_09990 [Ignavibacteriota bacterium]
MPAQAKLESDKLRAMQCPKCRLENPPSADACDCGYSFLKGVYVSQPVSPSSASHTAFAKRQYHALESISTGLRVGAWLVALVLVAVGVVILASATDQQRSASIPAALGYFASAALQWLVLKATAEAIILFVDIAHDVRAIAAKLAE